jgi:hypothetical protein
MSDPRWRRLLVLLIFGLVGIAACAPQTTDVPTVFVLPTASQTMVSTAVLPTITPLVITQPPVLPTATRLTSTPVPTRTPTPRPLYIEAVTSSEPVLITGWHDNCQPQRTEIRATIRSTIPIQRVTLKWTYEGRLDSLPGVDMQQIARADYVTTIGPFNDFGTLVYWVQAVDHDGNTALSEEYRLEIDDCDAPTPPPTRVPGPVPTDTPFYGEARSVQAVDQDVVVLANTSANVVLSWEGGVEPFVIDIMRQPDNGTLTGSGSLRTYTPNPGFAGADRVLFRVQDGNNQASTGTITLLVIEPET